MFLCSVCALAPLQCLLLLLYYYISAVYTYANAQLDANRHCGNSSRNSIFKGISVRRSIYTPHAAAFHALSMTIKLLHPWTRCTYSKSPTREHLLRQSPELLPLYRTCGHRKTALRTYCRHGNYHISSDKLPFALVTCSRSCRWCN